MPLIISQGDQMRNLNRGRLPCCDNTHGQDGHLGEAVPEMLRKTPGPSEFQHRGHPSDGPH